MSKKEGGGVHSALHKTIFVFFNTAQNSFKSSIFLTNLKLPLYNGTWGQYVFLLNN
jgi:hypothetical protein